MLIWVTIALGVSILLSMWYSCIAERWDAAIRQVFADSSGEEMNTLDIHHQAHVPIGAGYPVLAQMESEGTVTSRWDPGPMPAARSGRPRRLYKRRSSSTRTLWP